MQYLNLYNTLKQKTNYQEEHIDLGFGLCLRNFDFHSRIRFKLPEDNNTEAYAIPAAVDAESNAEGIHTLINKKDSEIDENLDFRYHMLMPEGEQKSADIVMMFHGFNEKYWYKYLPWAAHIVRKTGKAVVMFPIAFHMNRAPALWSEARAMNRASKTRKALHPALISSSLSNVAISTRLHNKPERFIWSGLESYHDVMDFVENVKQGKHPAIEADAGIDFCSYSIGTFLGEIIMMSNKNGYFSKSRYATFCGGPVFNRLSPVSKFILDSEANVNLYSYLVEHLTSHMKNTPELNELLSGSYEEGINFRSLLNYRDNLQYREEKFHALESRFYAIALEQDMVVPPYEVLNTLRGSRQNINIRVDVLDFPYAYRHEDPFPANAKIAGQVDACFQQTFNKISEFLSQEK